MRKAFVRAGALLLSALLLAGCTLRSVSAPEPVPTAAPVMALAATAGDAEPAPTPAPTPSPVPTAAPTATPCPHSVWVDGVCAGCGAVCLHPGWEAGRCAVCGVGCDHPSHDRTTRLCDRCGAFVYHEFLDSECSLCGAKPVFLDERVPRELFRPCEHKGSVATLTYTTKDYRPGGGLAPIEKELTVYLPYGYDPHEKYDLLILLHGIMCTENYWLLDEQEYYPGSRDPVYTRDLLDNLMDSGYCRKMIVAAPTFYRDSGDMSDYDRTYDEPQFLHELREDILPLLLDTYSTYARGNTMADMCAQRQHFAFAGLSMGSIYGYTSMLPYCMDIFGWYGCFSGSDGDMTVLAPQLNTGTNSLYPIYYFYNCIGTRDSMFYSHRGQYRMLADWVDRITDGKNAAFTEIKNGQHQYSSWSLGLYNFLQVCFALPPEDF